MTANPNETEKFGLAPEQLDTLFARTTEQAVADREKHRLAVAWPREVEQLLETLASRCNSQTGALADIQARLAAVETATGLGRG